MGHAENSQLSPSQKSVEWPEQSEAWPRFINTERRVQISGEINRGKPKKEKERRRLDGGRTKNNSLRPPDIEYQEHRRQKAKQGCPQSLAWKPEKDVRQWTQQWCAGQRSTTTLGGKLWSLAHTHFWGVNTPTMADFKLPVAELGRNVTTCTLEPALRYRWPAGNLSGFCSLGHSGTLGA